MSTSPAGRRRSGRDVAFQLVGFALGLALIAWCLHRAFSGDGGRETWERISAAPAWAIWGLALSSLASLAVNGLMFWFLVRPVRPIGVVEMQGINLVASVLNYLPLPLRVGLLARIAYHWRVNRMSALEIGALLGAAILVTMVVAGGLSAGVVAFPFTGAGIALGASIAALAIGVLLIRRVARWEFLVRRTRNAERIFADGRAFGGGVAMRTVDAIAWSIRMACAVAVLGLPLTIAESAILGLVAVAASMNPLGRFGFREATVAWLAGFLFAGRMEPGELEQAFARLAIVESAAEGAITVPLGAIALPWFLARMRKAPRRDESPTDLTTTSG